jgi:DNA mismatch repair protein MutS
MTSMIDEYRKTWTKYSAIYGPNTAVFLQVGSFYELYDIQDPITGICEMNVKEAVDCLGIQLTVKQDNSLFAGVPDYTLHKWAGRLTDAGWTVIVVDQVKDWKGKVAERNVSRILSPGTHIENAASTADSPAIAAIWCESQGEDKQPKFGAAVFDLTTGTTFTTAGTVRGRQDIWSSDSLVHFLQVYSPRELIFFWRGEQQFYPDEVSLRRRLNYPNGALHIRSASEEKQGNLEQQHVREELLRRVYNIQSLLPTKEWLRLQTEIEERSLVGLLRFVEDHLPSAFEKLRRNHRWQPDTALTLGNNALTQLQITSAKIQDSVLGLFRGCITPLGKRGIRQRILIPTANSKLLTKRYAQVESLFKKDNSQIHKYLRHIYDLPRIHRKIVCGTIVAADILCLHQSYIAAEELSKLVPMELQPIADLIENIKEWHKNCFLEEFSIEKAEKISDDITFLQSGDGHNERIYHLEEQLNAYNEQIVDFCKKCASLSGSDGFKIETREKIPYGIRGTKSGLTALKNVLASSSSPVSLISAFKKVEITIQKSGGWVEAPFLDEVNGKIIGARHQLQREFQAILPEICTRLTTQANGGLLWASFEEWIELIDVTQCIAKTSEERAYCRPHIENSNQSYFKAQKLRHPLIESILTRTEYVKHDVSIGGEQDRGWLVYGMNASGKSSLMKSIGIAIHLAQCGCFVPAAEFIYSPYRSLYTRILNQDNLWAGLSSFAVEMAEMRDILEAADHNTMVLGDELCAGTESVSAQALVAAGIEWLSQRKATYVFATHLHGLLEVLPEPSQISLKVWHLRVIYDAIRDILVYDRSLKPGSGSTLYGLEVARAMHLPVEFLEIAQRHRRKLLGTAVDEDAPKSAWNSAIQRRCCEVCGCQIVSDLEVHHIRPRCETVTGSKTFSDGSLRDDIRNLIVVCSKCHDKHHAGNIDIKPLKQTSIGPVRDIVVSVVSDAIKEDTFSVKSVNSEESVKNKSKWTQEEKYIILNVIKSYPNISIKQLVFKLEHDYEIEISESKLRGVRTKGTF